MKLISASASCFLLARIISGFPVLPPTNDQTYSSNYKILLCDSEQIHSHATHLQSLLPLVKHGMENAIVDVDMGTTSTHGFTAFFKTNTSQSVVWNVFKAIADNADAEVFPSGPRGPSELRQPTFVCLNEGQQDTEAIYKRLCMDPDTAVPMAKATNSEVLVICPLFWRLPSLPTVNMCPSLVDNKLVPTIPSLAANQYGVIVHELTHIYKLDAAVGMMGEGEVYDTQGAVELSPGASLMNANNFALYACGGRCSRSFRKEVD